MNIDLSQMITPEARVAADLAAHPIVLPMIPWGS